MRLPVTGGQYRRMVGLTPTGVGGCDYRHPASFTLSTREGLRSELDFLDDQVAVWEAKASKLDAIDTGYWPAALISVALLLGNDSIDHAWSSLSGAESVIVVLLILTLLGGGWWLLSRIAGALIGGRAIDKPATTLDELRTLRRIYRSRSHALESEAAEAEQIHHETPHRRGWRRR